MRIRKLALVSLDAIYAIAAYDEGDRPVVLAATEKEGPCLRMRWPDWEPEVLWSEPGGVMSLAPLGAADGLVAIERFFPVFQSEDAGIVYARPGGREDGGWSVTRVADLPFVHRVEIVSVGTEPFIVAATLCAGKDCVDDWSRPGAVYVGPVPRDPAVQTPWPLRPVLEGIVKNHGMHVAQLDGRRVVLISGQEGLFQLEVPTGAGEEWNVRQLLNHEISDMYVADVDGDGVPELVTIEPFHGNMLRVYKREATGSPWQAAAELPLDFGHVVWAGTLLGEPAILAGSRRGRKELSLIRMVRGPRRLQHVPVDIDTGVGPTQVAVVHRADRELIFSANHGRGEVTLYELTSAHGA